MPLKILIAGLISCVILLCRSGFAQPFNTNYSPARNYRPSAETMKAISGAFNEEIKNNLTENKKVREMINESLSELSKNIVALDSLRLILDSDTTTHYLKKIVGHICEKNPGLIKEKFYVFTSRTSVPNAFNFGKGVILFNLGMINKLRSEAEIAYVLCHEISHQLLDHVLKGIKKEAEIYYNQDFQKELKRARKQEYNSLQTTESLRLKYLSRFDEHSREHEYEADSLGLILFYNAGYSPAAAVSETSFLDSIDIPLYTAPINYRNYFEFKQQPFRNEWLTIDPTLGQLGGNLDSLYIPPDSLKTHPDCPLRAKAVERIAKRQNMNYNNNFLLSPNYSFYQLTSWFERVEYYLNQGIFGHALYDALQLSSRYPDNLFLKCAIANSLCEIYSAQINHTFSKAVDFPAITYSKSYNEFLSFLQNLSTSQLKSITINYCNENVINLKKEDSYCRYIGFLIKGIDKPKAEYASLVADYEKDNTLDAHYKTLLDEKYKSISSKKK
jgi:hypothetical protein